MDGVRAIDELGHQRCILALLVVLVLVCCLMLSFFYHRKVGWIQEGGEKLMRMKIGYCCGFGFNLISRRVWKVRLYDFFLYLLIGCLVTHRRLYSETARGSICQSVPVSCCIRAVSYVIYG